MKYFIGFLIMPFFVHSQSLCDYAIQGKVINDNQIPVSDAKILVQDLKQNIISETRTDLQGEYKINNICGGEYKVIIYETDYQLYGEYLTVKQDILQDFILTDKNVEHIEGIITTGLKRKKLNSISQNEISKSKINEYSDTNLGTVLSTISGVSTLSTGNNIVKPVIHGLHSSRVPVLNNEIRQEDQQWGVEHAPDIDVNIANTLSVIKGAGALQYSGDAIGGVILVEPKQLMMQDTLTGSILTSYVSNGRGGNISSSIEKGFGNHFSIRVQGTYKKLGNLSAPHYNLTNTGIEEKDFSFLAGYKNKNAGTELFFSYYGADTGILRAAHVGNMENLVNAINRRKPLIAEKFSDDIQEPKQEVIHRLLKWKSFYNFNFGQLKFIYGYQFNNMKEFDIRRSEYKGIPSLNLDLKTHDFNLKFSHYEVGNLKGEVGISYVFQENYPSVDTGISPLIPYYKKNSFGVYWMEQYKINDDFLIEGGFRYDYHKIDALKFYKKNRWYKLGYDKLYSDIIIGDTGLNYLTNPKLEYNGYAATVGLNYTINDHHSVVFNYATNNRIPNPGELFSDGVHHSAAVVELGSLTLKNERANKLILTLKNDFIKNKLELEITAHYNHIKDYINQIPKGAEYNIRGAFPVWEYVQTNADIFGLDVTGSYKMNSYINLSSDFSYLKGNDTKNSVALINIPPAQWITSVQYTNEKWMNFFAKASLLAMFRQTHYPSYNFDVQVVENGKLVTKVLDISTPPSSYQLLDFTTGFVLPFFHINDLNISFTIKNLLNTEYRNYLNRLRYYSDETGRNFILRILYNF